MHTEEITATKQKSIHANGVFICNISNNLHPRAYSVFLFVRYRPELQQKQHVCFRYQKTVLGSF